MDSIKHTKIVATISDKHCEPEFLQELVSQCGLMNYIKSKGKNNV